MARMTVYRLQHTNPKSRYNNGRTQMPSNGRTQQVILLPGGGQMVDVSNLKQHMDDFIQEWSLNEASQQLLIPLPMEAQVDIIMNFCPRDSSRDVNPVFQAFAKSRAAFMGVNLRRPDSLTPAQLVAHQTKAPATHAEVNAFCETWQLNEQSKAYLMSVPSELQSDIISVFQPRDLSRDVNNVFLAFASSRQRHSSSSQTHTLGRPTRSALVEFGRKWGLNSHSMELLYSFGHVVQEKILMSFKPHDTSRDVNNVFGAFARSRALLTFIDSWRLNEESAKQLKSMSHQVQVDIMTNFSPYDMTRDVNPLFQSFMRSRASHNDNTNNNNNTEHAGDKASAFAQRWNLKPENLQLLQSLGDEAEEDVVNNFRPRDDSRDVNALFSSFCRSRVAHLEGKNDEGQNEVRRAEQNV